MKFRGKKLGKRNTAVWAMETQSFPQHPPMSSHQLCEGQEAGMVAEGPSAPDHSSSIQAGPPDQGIGKQFRSVIPRGLA